MATVEPIVREVDTLRDRCETITRMRVGGSDGGGRETPVADISDSGAKPQTQLTARPALSIDSGEIVLCLASLATWLFFLTVGITVATQPMLTAVQSGGLGFFHVVGYLVVIAFCHTVPNMAILCCLSAFLGVVASRAVSGVSTTGATQERLCIYVASVTRGFFVFLVIVSGTILLSEQSFMNLTQERYIRLAGLSSLFSFAVGYNPGVFANLMERVTSDGMGGAQKKRAGA